MRRALLVGSAVLLAWAALVIATGGVHWRVGGLVLRSRDAARPIAAAIVLLGVYAIAFRADAAHGIARLRDRLGRAAPLIALLCAIALFAIALRFGTFTAGGADAYGYVSQAYGWIRGTLPNAEPIPIVLPWPSSDASLAPLGYRAGPKPHTIVPTYAPGLPWLMALAAIAGSCGPFLVVPICSACLVVLTYVLGRQAAGPGTGVIAALIVVSSPIAIFQSLWPMSDVPAGVFWTAAAIAALARTPPMAFASGLSTAAGLLVRPNLPLVALVLFLHLVGDTSGRERLRRGVFFSLPVVAVAIAVAALNSIWYGAPLNSGYGSASEIYSMRNVVPNVVRYASWMWQSQSPAVLFAIVAFVVPPFWRAANRSAMRLLAALFAATALSYLPYAQFEEWWYLRFLLPAIPALAVLTAIGMVGVGGRLGGPWGAILIAMLTAGEIAYGVRFSAAAGLFGGVQASERRYADVGLQLATTVPERAIVFTVQHSGSVRYYAGRLTLRWDEIDRAWAGRAAPAVERLGWHPYLLVEDWEVPAFREWFGLAPDVPLPWPLVARLREHGGVSVYDMASTVTGHVVPVSITPGLAPRCSAPKDITPMQ